MTAHHGDASGSSDLDAAIAGLGVDELRAIVTTAAARHEDVGREVRLAATRGTGDLSQLKAEVDRGLRTRRFLDYRESGGWATDARPIVESLRIEAATRPSAPLVELIERAIGHVVRVILNADDSDGAIGDVARDLLDLHADVCDAHVAEPVKLARWMLRFTLDDQDFFVADPVRYADALGELGLAAYRRDVQRRVDAGDTSFGLRYARERLAVVDRDVDAIVRLLGGDLSAPHQFIRVAEAMAELGRGDDVLTWATRGIEQTSGWQLAKLYDLAADAHQRRGETDAVLELRRAQHQRMPSATTYRVLHDAAQTSGTWPSGRDDARQVLAERDPPGLIDALLAELVQEGKL